MISIATLVQFCIACEDVVCVINNDKEVNKKEKKNSKIEDDNLFAPARVKQHDGKLI